jgi:hypothetical protein
VALSWPEEETTDAVEDFIGIVRGRTVNSSRGRRPDPERTKSTPKEAGTARRKPASGKPSAGKGARNPGGPKRGRGGRPRRRS